MYLGADTIVATPTKGTTFSFEDSALTAMLMKRFTRIRSKIVLFLIMGGDSVRDVRLWTSKRSAGLL